MRYLAGAVDAMLGGWDHAATLAAMRLAPGFADSRALDRFDFEVREQIPNAGLEALRDWAAPPDCSLDRFAAIEEWRGRWPIAAAAMGGPRRRRGRGRGSLGARRWTRRPRLWTGRGAIALGVFWRAVKAVLRLKPLRGRTAAATWCTS